MKREERRARSEERRARGEGRRMAGRTRGVVLLVAALAVIAAALAGVRYGVFPRHSTTNGPVILISIDTLRADHLPAYGYTKVRTPNIDALAADGTVFENAWSHSPQTLPAHTAILSGELPFENGVRDNIGFTVKPGQWLVQRALHDAGWPTGGFVSAYVLRHATGINQGFDVFDDDLPAASPELSIGQVQRDGAQTLAAAEKWLDTRDTSKPFFLFLHFYEPHKPYAPPARYSQYAPYDGEIAYADELVGRAMDRLKSLGVYDRATIILLGDHGEGLGDHGEQEHGMFLYRETTHIPLIIKRPGHAAVARVAAPVQHIDVVPTILDEAGIAQHPKFRGRSLRPLLDGTGTIEETGIYSEALYSRYHFGWSELYALTDARYRYIRAPRDELYDQQNDRAERTSIVDQRPQVHQAMRSALGSMIASSSITAPAAVTDEDRQRLAALGYVGTGSDASLTLPGDSLPDPKDKVQVLEKYRQASDLAGQLRYPEATVLYKELLAQDPEMSDVWLQLAQVYVRQNMTEDAVHAYKEVIKRTPKDAGSLLGAGGGLLRLGNVDEAKQYAELAVSVAPAGAHELLAKIALARHDREGALREAQAAQKADPTLPMPLYVQGLLQYNQGHYQEALPPLLEARQALQGRTLQMNDLNFYIGDSLARLERYQEAEPYLLEEIKVFPHNTRARASLAMLYRAMGRDAEAEHAIAELLRVSPTPEGRSLATKLWTMFGEPEKARGLK